MTGTTQAPPLAVTRAQRPQWVAALERANDAGLWLHEQAVSEDGCGLFACIHVESLTARTDPLRDASHTVYVHADDHMVRATCDCEAAVLGQKPCCHAALALEHLAAWPWPLTDPTQTVYAIMAAPPSPWRCVRCETPYETHAQLAQHMQAAHSSPPNPNRRTAETRARGVQLLTGRRS